MAADCTECHSALHAELKQLKEDQLRTLAILETLYQNQQALQETTSLLGISTHFPHPLHQTEQQLPTVQEQSSYPTTCSSSSSSSQSSFSSNDNSSCETSSDQDLSSTVDHDNEDQESRIETEDVIEECSTLGQSVIKHMWDDFTIDKCPNTDRVNPILQHHPRSPKFTIPRPFSMLAREASKPKRKSRGVLMAEQEAAVKKAEEVAMLNWQFRANPVPATTHLPLYELKNVHETERRQQVKSDAYKMLKSNEKPFSFTVRDNERRRERERQRRVIEEQEELEMTKRREFKARPVPQVVRDPKVDEELKEQEAYRKICVKVRAHETLAQSKLPSSMQVNSQKYFDANLRREHQRKKEEEAFMTEDHRFHPAVNTTIPDHDRAYQLFQEELLLRKQLKQTTTTCPFNLETETRAAIKKEFSEHYIEPVSSISSFPAVSKSVKAPYKSQTSSVPMTRSANLRQLMAMEKLAISTEEEEKQAQLKQEQLEKDKEMKLRVSLQSAANDLAPWLEKRRKENKALLRYEH